MMKSGFLILILCGLVLALLAAGCTTGPQANATADPTTGPAGTGAPASVAGNTTTLTAEGRTYPAYVAAPATAGRHPGLVLLHSFNGLEPGYRTMVDEIAAAGFVVVAPEWQTYGQRAGDDEVEGVVRSAVAFLENRSDVDPARLGLTGFCAGGRYTMLFLPQMHEFGAGVAWYGFPYNGPPNNTAPAELIADLESPMLMIHGSRDQASNITDIYNYTRQLDAADRYFEAQGLPGQAPRVHDPERHPRPRRRGPGRLHPDDHVLQADPGIAPVGAGSRRDGGLTGRGRPGRSSARAQTAPRGRRTRPDPHPYAERTSATAERTGRTRHSRRSIRGHMQVREARVAERRTRGRVPKEDPGRLAEQPEVQL